VGVTVGDNVIGRSGTAVGLDVVGEGVGTAVGRLVGTAVGMAVVPGTAVDGLKVGRFVNGGNNGNNADDGTCVWPATGASVAGASDTGTAVTGTDDIGADEIAADVTGLEVEMIGG
jgi:hypothetical protein